MMRVRSRGGLWAALAGAALLVAGLLPASANLSGAIYSTDNVGTTNVNVYEAKSEVYLNGGPRHPGAAGLPDGQYYAKVTEPDGTPLGDPLGAPPINVVNGEFTTPYQLITIVKQHSDGAPGFDDTTNGGGEYKVWVSPDPTFPNSNSKTDNFKVGPSDTTPPQTVLSGLKYRDTDLDGQLGPSDTPIPDWTIELNKLNTNANKYEHVSFATTDGDGKYEFIVPNDGSVYQICEVQQAGWTQKGPIPGAVPIVEGLNQSYASADASRCWVLQTTSTVNTIYNGLDFGNIPAVTIGGVKYNDANLNGQQDMGEGTISNPTFSIQVVATLPDAAHTQLTDTYPTTNGAWTSNLYPAGTTFVATEINVPANWQNTGGAAGYQGTVGDTATTGLDFGNVQLASIGGAKYNDANMNGKQDASEALIPSTTAAFNFHVVATLPDVNATVVTKDYANDSTGHWQSDLFPYGTTFVVTETNVPANWQNTGGTAGYQGAVDGTNTALDFGNVQLARISGVKYNDANMNGQQGMGEALIPSTTAAFTFHVVATLPNGTVATKDYGNDATGHWQSDLYPVGTTFVVTEVNVPANWQNTGGTVGYSGSVTATTVTGLDFGNIQLARISGVKYYDANGSGGQDMGEVLIPNSAAAFTFHVVATLPNGTVVTKNYANDGTGHWQSDLFPYGTTFVVTETNVPANWQNTGGTAGFSGSVDGTNTALNFGNLKLGAGGGLTLGFWSNKNGLALLGTDDLAMLVALNLRNADGSCFDPATAAKFQTWILNATATNMAYMLSAQLAAMELNVLNGNVSKDAFIYAPGTSSANALGFAKVCAVMDEANTILGTNGTNKLTILDGNPLRARAEAVKTALDKANNNLNFVVPFP